MQNKRYNGQQSEITGNQGQSASSGTPARFSGPELLAPAGSYSAGWYALQAGADAVYLGLKDFSARKGARNFTLDEVARLKGLAEAAGKKIYAALNTVIRDDELRPALETVYDLVCLGIDGVILQDIGFLYLIRKNFPRLPIHASTQMAVHNSQGVTALKQMGVRRFILARELTWEEIKQIRQDHPEVELEVFIHGALCYSVSGLCLASGLLLGRSGNRGECAQICRSWFEVDSRYDRPKQPGSTLPLPRRGYFFSCKDLAVEQDILKLRDLGVNAFKIEGRLKPPEWVAAVTAYYRTLLDTSIDSSGLLEKARMIFSRSLTRGYGPGNAECSYLQNGLSQNRLFAPFGCIVDPQYPGHRGIPAGKVLAVQGKKFLLKTETELAIRDGLLFFRSSGDTDASLLEAVLFGILRITLNERGGQPILSSKAGTSVWIEAKETPPPGSTVYKISSHAEVLPEPPRRGSRKKILLDMRITILIEEKSSASPKSTGRKSSDCLLNLSLLAPDNVPGIDRSSESPRTPLLSLTVQVPVEPARSSLTIEEVFQKYLSPPGNTPFALGNLEVKVSRSPGSLDTDTSSFSRGSSLFIPPSILKDLRRNLYARVGEELSSRKQQFLDQIVQEKTNDASAGTELSPVPSRAPVPRAALPEGPSGLPFLVDQDLEEESLDRFRRGDTLYLPLCPVLFHPEPYWKIVKERVYQALEQNPYLKISIGLGNPGHIALADDFKKEERVSYFIDYGLYVANRFTVQAIREQVPRLIYFYPWVEEEAVQDFSPPLFISRACVIRSDCSNPLYLKQGKQRFLLRSARVVGTCLNILFLTRANHPT